MTDTPDVFTGTLGSFNRRVQEWVFDSLMPPKAQVTINRIGAANAQAKGLLCVVDLSFRLTTILTGERLALPSPPKGQAVCINVGAPANLSGKVDSEGIF